MAARLYTLHPLEGFRPKTFAGHKDAVLGAYFSAGGKSVYSSIALYCMRLTNA
jgi:periodic tryptophan protein 2